MDLNLKNKKVFISGSSRGIGLTIAKSFVEEGAKVVINSRNEDSLKVVTKSFSNSNSVAGDISNPEVAQKVIAKSTDILGGLDILVCNVGSGSSVKPGSETYSEWQKVFGMNFFSTTNLVEASHKFLKKSRGSIVCISSICGNDVIPGAPVTYSVAKAALNKYVKSISYPLAKDGIRINAVAPGNINFPGSSWEKKMGLDPEAVSTMLKNNVPLEQFGSPDDVAILVMLLASDIAKFMTGAVITTDGGQTRS